MLRAIRFTDAFPPRSAVFFTGSINARPAEQLGANFEEK
jgi:hypothetical protein